MIAGASTPPLGCERHRDNWIYTAGPRKNNPELRALVEKGRIVSLA